MRNILGLTVTPGTTIDQATAASFASLIAGSITAGNVPRNMHTSCQCTHIGIRDLRVAHMPEYTAAVAVIPGTSATEPLPPELAIVATLRTAKAGRSFRGRIYTPFNANEAWSATTQSYTPQAVIDNDAFWNNFRQSIPNMAGHAGQFQLAVLSRCYGSEQSNPVVSIQTRSAIQGSQRRRIPHRG